MSEPSSHGKNEQTHIETKDYFNWTPQMSGTYTFSVQAIDRDLNYSQPARVALKIFTPWHKNAWVTVPSVAGSITLITALVFLVWRSTLQRREAYRQLEVAKDLADAANRAKSAFLANMSHEIRTPMNAILGYAEILRRAEDLPTDHIRAVETIFGSGEHLLELINEVLDLSRIEAGRLEVQNQDFELVALISGIAAMFSLRCQQKELSWKVEWQLARVEAGGQETEETKDIPARIWVNGDENKPRQSLINLLSNAVKFTEQGSVTLRITRPHVQIPLAYTFEVIDTGGGIAEEYQPKIFEPFQRGGAAPTIEGTGLGLTITQKRVQIMGGEISFESKEGKGSRFFLTVPLGQITSQPEESSASIPRKVVHLADGIKVDALVVDDVAENRDVLETLLSDIGVSVRLASNGQQAVDACRRVMPSIVFMDMRMPVMGGLSASKQIWSEFGKACVKIVAVSASTLDHQRENYLAQGFDGFIPKPFRAQQIYDCLAELLHVEYQYPSDVTSEGDALDFSGLVVPKELLTRLKGAAELYRFTALNEHLDQLAALSPEMDRLAQHLRRLAADYDMEAVLSMLGEISDE